MPVTLPTTDFFAHHSPFGAFASFSIGRYGKKGGFGLELPGPAQQDVYVAVARPGKGGVRAFPFYAGAQAGGAEAYTGSAEPAGSASDRPSLNWQAFSPEGITRSMGWASDTWSAGPLTFRLLTPFGPVPDPETASDDELRRALCPAILAELTVDNSDSDTEAFAFFGIGAADGLRPLSDATEGRLLGVARETQWGFAVKADHSGTGKKWKVRETLWWGIQEAVASASSATEPPMNRLSNRGGLLLQVPPGETRTFTLALGFYRSGIVTSGIPAAYLYTRLFPGIESVLSYALENADALREEALARDAELDAASINDERKFLLTHATHSYHGSTMLLTDETNLLPHAPDAKHRPLWVVNEGEYRMMNTFDLTVDQAFWEMRYHSWTLKNTLDLFIARYSYTDEVQDATDAKQRPRFPGGLSFTHDMGVANQFSPAGYSSYERPDLDDCFSYMTQEQLCNWCLSAAIYALPALHPGGGGGDSAWLSSRRDILLACLDSLIRRDGPGELRNGVMSLDSLRCGRGQEITTYDSLDASLGQARANAYLAVKTWASYLALSRCLHALGESEPAVRAEEQAARAAESVSGHFNHEEGFLPAVFEEGNPGNHSRIIPAIEGLAFPYLTGDGDAVSEHGHYSELISLLRRHLQTVLVPGVCIDSESGGFKMSSTSTNTWMSKIFLCQFVAETVLGVPLDESFDAAHARWQRDGDSRDHAFTDQVHSSDGRDLGSRYYPRGVTAVLWLMGTTRKG